MAHLNWSHFKPEFSGKPEDVEAHLLRTNDWMNTNWFPEDINVERFCLTLVGEARLWYELFRPNNIDWQGLQNQFKQQYSKIGNTREQLFHTWWSFHFDENTETLDAYITCIRQVSTLLGYGEPQILEVFKNTLPTKLYWVLFPIDDLRQGVETAKRILMKKIDRQLAGQSSSTPFMSIKDSYKKKVTFDTWYGLEEKIDSLTVIMGKLATRDNGTNRQFRPQLYIRIKEGDRIDIFMTDIILISAVIKIGTDQIAEIGEFYLMDKVEVDQGMKKIIAMIIGEEILEVMWECINILKDRMVEENIEEIIEMKITVKKEVGVGLEKDQFQGILIIEETAEA